MTTGAKKGIKKIQKSDNEDERAATLLYKSYQKKIKKARYPTPTPRQLAAKYLPEHRKLAPDPLRRYQMVAGWCFAPCREQQSSGILVASQSLVVIIQAYC